MEISSCSSSSWERLPVSLQESILLLLPISALIRCTAVSRSLRSLIRSSSFVSSYRNYPNTPQPLFLFFDNDPSAAVADVYDPLLDRWTSLPSSIPSASIRISDGPHLLLSSDTGFLLSDPFSNLRANDIRISNIIINNDSSFYPIALVSESRRQFKIVLVCAIERLYSLVYDSTTGEWAVNRALPRRFAVVTNGVLLNGLLYCLSRGPDHLLSLDPARGRWEVLDVSLPASRCSQVLVFEGRLMLVAGVEEIGAIVGVGIWELDWGRMEWRAHCFMPEDVFGEFSDGGINYFQTVDRSGMICFLGNRKCGGASILMCDLWAKRWWWPRACRRRNVGMHYCSVHAVDPYIDLVKPEAER